MKLEIVPPPPCWQVFHWNLAPWSHIRGHFRRYCWNPTVWWNRYCHHTYWAKV